MFVPSTVFGMLEPITFIALCGMLFGTGVLAMKVISSELKLRALIRANKMN